jgi:DNA-binding NtrC family response regulator
MAQAFASVPAPSPSPDRDPAALDDLFDAFFASAAQRRGSAPNLSEWVELAEGWRIVRALREARGNRAAAARALGIGRRTLYTKMEKLGIAPKFSLW